jgi:hypothetical protein
MKTRAKKREKRILKRQDLVIQERLRQKSRPRKRFRILEEAF